MSSVPEVSFRRQEAVYFPKPVIFVFKPWWLFRSTIAGIQRCDMWNARSFRHFNINELAAQWRLFYCKEEHTWKYTVFNVWSVRTATRAGSQLGRQAEIRSVGSNVAQFGRAGCYNQRQIPSWLWPAAFSMLCPVPPYPALRRAISPPLSSSSQVQLQSPQSLPDQHQPHPQESQHPQSHSTDTSAPHSITERGMSTLGKEALRQC